MHGETLKFVIFCNFSKRNIKAPSRLCRSTATCRSDCNVILFCICEFVGTKKINSYSSLKKCKSTDQAVHYFNIRGRDVGRNPEWSNNFVEQINNQNQCQDWKL